MSIGYACLTKGVPEANYRTCRKSNATEENLKELIGHNLSVLEKMIDYNHKEGIRLFRISSDIIPFGSDFIVNDLDWPTLFEAQFNRIGEKIKRYDIRVSMHPGQYTVLNSPRKEVVDRAIDDLTYHTLFLDLLGTTAESKIILHVGGVYGDKASAMDRFADVYQQLDERIKDRLIIENDDRSYTIEEVLTLSQRTGAPVVYDNLHHRLNNDGDLRTDSYWINKAKETWHEKDGRPKVHYSQQQLNGREGAHSQFIRIDEFMGFYEEIKPCKVDIMLEVKDKNLSAVKCQLATTAYPEIGDLEKEWSRYKYTVLERSPVIYESIRNLLKDKSSYPVIQFYRLIEAALSQDIDVNKAINSLDHVWGYLNKQTTAKEKERYQTYKANIVEEPKNLERVKRFLYKLALKYNQDYLLGSLYFEF
ncbi:UV-damage endonuclease [Alkalibacterium subtropicum]|uniref:UV-damage endonuclease n=1 Tax=Alkalibacterium subtropicum TaxID=753702 RepID=A0A1I1HF44_9LACT|nr:UV DNA damage repair endonuclease UvsE [Alkalibacterium subtropicum]SFC22212.1 UV-damage endonuclease [Alkalibacterium subtropicum]